MDNLFYHRKVPMLSPRLGVIWINKAADPQKIIRAWAKSDPDKNLRYVQMCQGYGSWPAMLSTDTELRPETEAVMVLDISLPSQYALYSAVWGEKVSE